MQDIQWDPSGHRVAVSFKNTNSICILRSKPKQARLSPVGWVTCSISGEFPVCMQFQQSPVDFGAVLTIVWSNDRVQHLHLCSISRKIFSQMFQKPKWKNCLPHFNIQIRLVKIEIKEMKYLNVYTVCYRLSKCFQKKMPK